MHAERVQLPASNRSCQMAGHCDGSTTVLLTRPGSCEIWDAISEGSWEGRGDWAAAAARAPSASASASQRLMKWNARVACVARCRKVSSMEAMGWRAPLVVGGRC